MPTGDYNTCLILGELTKLNDQFKRLADNSGSLNELTKFNNQFKRLADNTRNLNDHFKRLLDNSGNLNELFLKSLTPSLDKYNDDQRLLNLLKFKIMNVFVEFDREQTSQPITNTSTPLPSMLHNTTNNYHHRPY